ncbi:Os05g0478500 [Oryza sativa Japonica Group]|uniref:Os05g0478500 protein n=1 Tax=Oryza sativa subsp. japonica TaxID=39947 RepID=A0A0P0WNU7_ORYSJ|nr:Os05g0478500 [Oryza sativa Japonica Group]
MFGEVKYSRMQEIWRTPVPLKSCFFYATVEAFGAVDADRRDGDFRGLTTCQYPWNVIVANAAAVKTLKDMEANRCIKP